MLIPRFRAIANPWFFWEKILILSEYFFRISSDESSDPSSTAIISISSYTIEDPVKISELKSVNPQVYFTQEDKNKERYNRGKFSETGTTYEEWLVNPDAWGDRNKGCWPMNHKEIVKIHKLVQKRRKGFEKDIMRQMKEEVKKISEKESESEMVRIKSMLTNNTYIVPTTPSVKTRELILWEGAVEKQRKNVRSKKGFTYEEALDKQRSKELYKSYKNSSSARALKKAEQWMKNAY